MVGSESGGARATLHEVYGQELFELLDTVPGQSGRARPRLACVRIPVGLTLADIYFEEPSVFPREGKALVDALRRPTSTKQVIRPNARLSWLATVGVRDEHA